MREDEERNVAYGRTGWICLGRKDNPTCSIKRKERDRRLTNISIRDPVRGKLPGSLVGTGGWERKSGGFNPSIFQGGVPPQAH